MKYSEVLLPIPLNRTFTYALNADLEAKPGMRVVVPFGKRKFHTGIIINVHDKAPQDYDAKEITEILDDAPVIGTIQLKFLFWMAEYYMCTSGEVLNAALPAGLKISSETNIQLNPSYADDGSQLTDDEFLVVQVLEQRHSLTFNEVVKLISATKAAKTIKSLEQKEVIQVYQELKEKYVPKKEKYIRLRSAYLEENKLQDLFEMLSSKPKQEEVILAFLQESGADRNENRAVLKGKLKAKDISLSSLKTLVKNDILEEFEIEVSRFESLDDTSSETPQLADFQENALNDILSKFETQDQCLMHGITGSGKTAIYIHLIKHLLDSGHQALLLLPEIALTTQIVMRLKQVFGSLLGVYHSKFSDNERVEVWMGVLSGKFPVVVGVRSSLFLPFDNLGLVIVDEEHETTYKQFDPAPRYHARDAAIMLSRFHQAKVLMGTATPSMETYFQAEGDKYGLIELNKRYGEATLPEIKTIDLSRAIKKKQVNGHFTEDLIEQMNGVLAAKRQIIIFQNRRGYSPFMECQNCGWVPKCINCAVSLTYHQYQEQLRCHYCGYNQQLPNECEECASTLLQTMGFGTEKLEEDLRLLLPDARIQRMDLETTRAKNSYQRIIEDFTEGKTDILIGTQMVTKGLDFENVALVGIVDFDRMLHFPDFRSYERTFDLAMQVSGRAGRGKEPGKVYIQTYNPNQYILDLIKASDYKSFYQRELSERARFQYPPYTRLIKITLKHRNKTTVTDASRALSMALTIHFQADFVLGPEAPMINRIKNKYLMDITIKLPRKNFNLNNAKEIIRHEVLLLERHPVYKNVQIVFDVDPF